MTSAEPEVPQAPEVHIHNGQIVSINGKPPEPEPGQAQKPANSPPAELDPEKIAAAMARVISEQLERKPRPTPMEIVNSLLQLTHGPHKLVWTRFDVYQCFGKYAAAQQGKKP